MAFKEIMIDQYKPSDEEYDAFFDNFAGYFLSGSCDFVSLAAANKLAKENGWVNPFGWDSDTGEILLPLTRLFRSATSISYMLQRHYDRAVSGEIPMTRYEQAVVGYIRDGLYETAPAAPIYEALIQTQSQVAEYAIYLRSEFERFQGRPMLRQDWDEVGGDVYRLVMRKAALSKSEAYKGGISMCFGSKPFEFQQGAGGNLEVSEGAVDQDAVLAKIREIGMSEYIELHATRPATGCPVLRSNTGAGVSLVGFAVKTFMKAVSNDFWPQPKEVAACPYHRSPN